MLVSQFRNTYITVSPDCPRVAVVGILKLKYQLLMVLIKLLKSVPFRYFSAKVVLFSCGFCHGPPYSVNKAHPNPPSKKVGNLVVLDKTSRSLIHRQKK